MLYEILVGFVLAISYLVGALIYLGTKDECVPFSKKYKFTITEIILLIFRVISTPTQPQTT